MFRFFLFFTIVFIVACSTVHISTYYYQKVDLTHYNSYAWLLRPDSVNALYYKNAWTEQHIKAFVNEEMKERGYYMDERHPDILLEYHLAIKVDTAVIIDPVYDHSISLYNPPTPVRRRNVTYKPYAPYSYNNTSYRTGYDIEEVKYLEGSLIIDAVDQSDNLLVWRGVAEDSVASNQAMIKELQSDIRKIFKKYPARK